MNKEATLATVALLGAGAAIALGGCSSSGDGSASSGSEVPASSSTSATGKPTASSAGPVEPSPESSLYTAQPASYFVTNASSEIGEQLVVGPLDKTDLEPTATVVSVAYPGQKPQNEYVDLIVNSQTGATIEAFVPSSIQPDVKNAANGVLPALYLQGRVGLSGGYPVFSATQPLVPTPGGITTANINQMPGPYLTGRVPKDKRNRLI